MGEHINLPEAATATAPDGSLVHILPGLGDLSTARFEFPPRSVSVAVRHRTVDEVWHFISGQGEFWSDAGPGDGIAVAAGTSISILAGETFQVRSISEDPLVALGVTSPAWPGDGEAELMTGPWTPTLKPGPH